MGVQAIKLGFTQLFRIILFGDFYSIDELIVQSLMLHWQEWACKADLNA